MAEQRTDPFSRLRDRSPIGWIRERDIDLLLCSELFHNIPLCALIGSVVGFEDPSFEAAWVSVLEADGESDLVVGFTVPGGYGAVLIENKIAAGFQPDQAARYAMRADRLRQEPGLMTAATLLIAPARYLSGSGAEDFDARLSYEQVMGMLQDGDARSKFFAHALASGIESSQRGYVMVPNAAVTRVWQAIADEALRIAPALRFSFSGEKPCSATWPAFKDAEGMGVLRGIATLILKGEKGQADLEVKNCTPDSLRRAVADLLETGMTIERATNSASIRLSVPRIDFKAPPEGQLEAIRDCLVAMDRLRRFAVDGDLAFRLSGTEA